MLKFINTIKTLAALLPAIIDFVKAIEAALPANGQGAQKLAFFREMLATAYQASGDIGVSLDEILPTAERAASAVVGLFNRTGVFQQTGTGS